MRRVALVVLAHHAEGDGLAADHEVARVGLVDRERHAVLVVLALVGDGAGERARVADEDRDAGGGRRGRRRVAAARGEHQDRREER